MKISFYIALSLMTLSFGGCTSTPDGYRINGNEVRYVYRDLKSNTWINKAIPADAATFQSFEDGFHLAKDKNHVFKRGEIWDTFDASSFEVLSASYYGDKNGLYFGETSLDSPDRSTFKIMSKHLAVDKNALFYRGKRLDLCDAATLEIPNNRISYQYIYDSQCAYYLTAWATPKAGFRVNENLETFREISPYHAKDSESVFAGGVKIEGADPASFTVIGSSTGADQNAVFYRHNRIVDADRNSYKSLGSYGVDKHAVFYKGRIIKGADPKTFETLPREKFNSPEARDANNFYSRGSVVTP
jgi:hypothetical protein